MRPVGHNGSGSVKRGLMRIEHVFQMEGQPSFWWSRVDNSIVEKERTLPILPPGMMHPQRYR